MSESILDSIKKLLGGIENDDDHFDVDIMFAINSALATLTQNGVGPDQGFSIEDSSATWTDFIGEVKNMEFVKSYVFIPTKLLFDPPLSSAVMEMYNKKADEYLWRIQDVVSENQEENQNGE